MTTMKTYLIINADDLGYSAERDDGILQAFQGGLLTSASLLVNGASAASALRKAVAVGLPVGLHLNLTEGTPVSPLEQVASLLTPPARKYLRGKLPFREAVAAGEVIEAEICVEVEAQVARFRTLHPTGAAPTHIDGHQHIQVLPPVVHAIGAACVKHGIKATRIPALCSGEEEILQADVAAAAAAAAEAAGGGTAADSQAGRGMTADRLHFYRGISASCAAARLVYAAVYSVVAPQTFIGYSTMSQAATMEGAAAALTAAMQHATAMRAGGTGGTQQWVEWMMHPGKRTLPRTGTGATGSSGSGSGSGSAASGGSCAGEGPHAVEGDAGCGEGPDDFSMDPGREQELHLLLDNQPQERSGAVPPAVAANDGAGQGDSAAAASTAGGGASGPLRALISSLGFELSDYNRMVASCS